MVATYLVEHRSLMPFVLLVVVLVGPVVGAWLSPRPRAARVLTGLALVGVVALTMVPPDSTARGVRCAVEWSVPTPARVEAFANVVLLVPLVLLLGVALARPVLAGALGSLVSVAIEVVQALVPAIGRACDTDDWLANTIGAVIGAVLAGLALRPAGWWRRRAIRGA